MFPHALRLVLAQGSVSVFPVLLFLSALELIDTYKLLTLGRVPTETRTATATMKRMSTAAARTIESEPDDAVCGGSSSIEGPACPGTPTEASLSAGGTGGAGAGL